MGRWFKQNWFRLGILIVLALVGGSIAYYFGRFLPRFQKDALEKMTMQKAAVLPAAPHFDHPNVSYPASDPSSPQGSVKIDWTQLEKQVLGKQMPPVDPSAGHQPVPTGPQTPSPVDLDSLKRKEPVLQTPPAPQPPAQTSANGSNAGARASLQQPESGQEKNVFKSLMKQLPWSKDDQERPVRQDLPSPQLSSEDIQKRVDALTKER